MPVSVSKEIKISRVKLDFGSKLNWSLKYGDAVEILKAIKMLILSVYKYLSIWHECINFILLKMT